jgi:hypothetical protein
MSMLKGLLLCAALSCGLWAGEEPAGDFGPQDVLYAPEELSGTAAEAAPAQEGRASYYSTAKITVEDAGHGGLLEGADIFLDGRYLGQSPLELSGFLVNKPRVSMSARKAGYWEALRPALILPGEGEARIAMAGDNAAGWYTTPGFVLGLLLLGSAAVASTQNDSSSAQLGIGLACGAVGVVALTQGIARLIHLPALAKKTAARNAAETPLP